MVHFIYKLNLFGDKESRKEARANKGSEVYPRPEGAMPPMTIGERPPMPPTRGGGMPMRGPGMGFGGGFGGGFGPM